MTTESSVSSDTDHESDDQREQIVSYLVTKADHGSFQCKSTFLAEELEIPAWDVTQMMADIDDSVSELEIEELTYSRSTTWRVTYDPS